MNEHLKPLHRQKTADLVRLFEQLTVAEDHAEADKNLLTDVAFLTLFSECSPSLAQIFSIDMHQLSFLYMLNIVTRCPRVVVHMRETVFTLAKELVSHPMPEHVDKLSTLVRIKLAA